MSPRTMGAQHKKASVAHFHALRLHRGSVKRTAQRKHLRIDELFYIPRARLRVGFDEVPHRGRPDLASSRHSCLPVPPTGRPKNVQPAPALATGSTRDSKSKNASSVDDYRLCMSLGGYMTCIAAKVAVYEATRKQAESEPTRGDEIEMLTEQLNVQQPIPPT